MQENKSMLLYLFYISTMLRNNISSNAWELFLDYIYILEIDKLPLKICEDAW